MRVSGGMPKPNSSRPSLLLVDDTPANIAILVEHLRGEFDLTVATSGAQALDLCRRAEHIDLVLLDVMMPAPDGHEVCRQLRAAPQTRHLPIIFLTAKTDTEDVVQGFELGANDYVTKPFRPAELLARVRTHLLLRAQQQVIAAKNEEMKELLHIVCHDVANQFTIIDWSLQFVRRAPERADKYLPRINAAARNGIALTGMLRDMRREEEKGLKLAPVDLLTALEEALLLAEGKIQDKALRIEKSFVPLRVMGDATALTNSVFGNVISNAIKFSPKGGTIRLTGEVEGPQAVVRVRDQGIGMSPELAARLFDATQDTSRDGTAGERGTGFGMPLMHKFVTLFGGTVSVSSREAGPQQFDHGTEFTIRLLLADA